MKVWRGTGGVSDAQITSLKAETDGNTEEEELSSWASNFVLGQLSKRRRV